jgi:hypothetical protein
MSAAAVQFYDVVLWVHIVAFFIAFGPTYAYGLFFAMAAKAGPAATAQTGRAVKTWDTIAGGIGAVIILASGIYLTADRWEFSDFFISWGLIVVILILGLTHGFFLPRTQKVIDLLDAGREEEARAEGQTVGKAGAFLGVAVILTIYVMTAKPFL